MLRGLRAKVVFILSIATATALMLIGLVLYQVQKKGLVSQFIDDAEAMNMLLQNQSHGNVLQLYNIVKAMQEIPSAPGYSSVMIAGNNDDSAISMITRKIPGQYSEKVRTMLEHCRPGFIDATHMHLVKLFPVYKTGGKCINLAVISNSPYLTKKLFLLIEVLGAYILLNIFILVVISWLVIDRYTVVPLRRFEQAVEGVGSGNYPRLGEMPYAAELHQIVKAFNAMTSAIQTKQQHLTDTIKELKETRDLAVKRERLATIGSFSSGISHEIGNPLSAIISILEALKSSISNDNTKSGQKTDPEINYKLDMINRSLVEAYRIDALIKQLLQYVRQKPVSLTDVNIKSLVDDVMSSVELNRDLKDVKVSTDIEPGMVCKTDYEKLRQVLINLITNALDAMQGKGRLGIKSAYRQGYHSIEVTDTGGGIAGENLEKIFEPFFTTKPSGKGTGLGLAIVKNLMQDLNGDISVSSSGSSGTAFTVKLPQAQR